MKTYIDTPVAWRQNRAALLRHRISREDTFAIPTRSQNGQVFYLARIINTVQEYAYFRLNQKTIPRPGNGGLCGIEKRTAIATKHNACRVKII